jgi:transposase
MKKKKPELFSNRRFRELVGDWVQGETNRQILILFYVEDRTQEEIETELHVSVSTVKRVCKKFGMEIFRMMDKTDL